MQLCRLSLGADQWSLMDNMRILLIYGTKELVVAVLTRGVAAQFGGRSVEGNPSLECFFFLFSSVYLLSSVGCTDPSVLESLIPFPPISRWFVCKAADSPLCQAQELSCLAVPSHLSGGFCLSFLSARKEMLRLQTNPRGL